MSIGKEFLKELMLESEVTRRYLESVPFDKLDYKPSEKSESLGRLAIHLAEIIAWWSECILNDKLDFIEFQPEEIKSNLELVKYFDQLLEKAKADLMIVKDIEFEEHWSMTYGNELLFTLPKKQVARLFCMNHMIHHRAQLGVYLRLLGIPVPAVYGPSADDNLVTIIKGY